MGGAGEEAGEDTPRVGQCGGGDCQRLVRWRRLPTMKVCLTALFLGVACFLFQAGAAEPTEAERKFFLETKAKAEKGLAGAQSFLGDMYGDGLGVAKDEAEAVKWYRKAADQGYATAQFNLGVIYANLARQLTQPPTICSGWA